MEEPHQEVLEGVFAVAKQAFVSSADVLQKLQATFATLDTFAPLLRSQPTRPSKGDDQVVKTGHGGTLDPLAAGVLIVGIGRGTKQLQNYLACSKTYETVVLFGASTDTYDCTGVVTERAPHQYLTKELVEEHLAQFRGKIAQVLPVYSALKVNGVKACEYARAGKELPRELESREMVVDECTLLEWYDGGQHDFNTIDDDALTQTPAAQIRLTVSSGFYVRSFAHDLGLACSSRSHMAALHRTRQADYIIGGAESAPNLVTALTYAELDAREEVWATKLRPQLEAWVTANPIRTGHFTIIGVKRVAVVGLGPGGAITIDALAREKVFDTIRVFEKREAAGGCWLEDAAPPPNLDPTTFDALAARNGDLPIQAPPNLPGKSKASPRMRYTESSVYPYFETNVDSIPMSFSQESIPEGGSPLSIAKYGNDAPFRHHSVVRGFIQSLVNRNGYEKLVSYNTTVELAEKVGDEWRLVLRKSNNATGEDEWWEERFDAVCVASGHYSVPYIPKIPGLAELEKSLPGSVKHSKMFRGRDLYRGKKVVVVGASVSAADIAYDLTGVAKSPVYAVNLGHKPNGYFGDIAFQHPGIRSKPSISHITTTNSARTVHFVDGTSVHDVDDIIFGTGYSWTLPFLPNVEVRNNRVPNLYQHVVYTPDPSLLFIGAVSAGLTFKVFEWHAVLAARILAGRATLPPLAEQQRWEQERIEKKGDGPVFTHVFPDLEEYFEEVRRMAGEEGPGRKLPRFEKMWVDKSMAGHERRKKWWREENERARKRLRVDEVERERARL